MRLMNMSISTISKFNLLSAYQTTKFWLFLVYSLLDISHRLLFILLKQGKQPVLCYKMRTCQYLGLNYFVDTQWSVK